MLNKKSFFHYLETLTSEHGISKDLIYQGVTAEERQHFTAQTILKIADNLNVDASCLLEQNVNIEALQNSLAGKAVMPSDYAKAAYSSTTSLNSVLAEFKKFGRYEQVLRVLQIDKSLLNTHQPLSILVVKRAMELMKNFLSPEEIRAIATRNADSFLDNQKFGKVFLDDIYANNPLEALFENTDTIENNWSYKIVKSKKNEIIIDTRQTELMMDVVPHNYTSNELIQLRFQFAKRVMERAGHLSHVEQLSPVDNKGQFQFKVSCYSPMQQFSFG